MSDVSQSGFRRDILESAIPAIVEQDVAAASGGDEQILEAIVVVIGKRTGDRHATVDTDARFGGYILESAVALVAIERIGPVLIEEVDVIAAVVVEVADGEARSVVVKVDPESLLALFVGQVVHLEVDSGRLRAFNESG